ncbi:hypothetical protein BDN71DRAFT_1452164 [Pleurotus eryngii]|uniref:Uncharacterized protein n=1 Tax=Pleurotus eryngii TaxID=5323 RepID=A0A9P6D472_PLEER|nr:hypothetical protein BDN71DRAFT_1452164 [Pleurotus eryngii]
MSGAALELLQEFYRLDTDDDRFNEALSSCPPGLVHRRRTFFQRKTETKWELLYAKRNGIRTSPGKRKGTSEARMSTKVQ